jgi:retron-type reverse transcriptase
MAIAHTLLIMAYHIVKEQCTYTELGADYFDRLNEQYLIKRLTSRIETLGYHVTLQKEETLPA